VGAVQRRADAETAERSLAGQKAQAEAEGRPWPPEPHPASEPDPWHASEADPAGEPKWQAPGLQVAEAETSAYQGAIEAMADIEAELA
jgi:hypothetical protein